MIGGEREIRLEARFLFAGAGDRVAEEGVDLAENYLWIEAQKNWRFSHGHTSVLLLTNKKMDTTDIVDAILCLWMSIPSP